MIRHPRWPKIQSNYSTRTARVELPTFARRNGSTQATSPETAKITKLVVSSHRVHAPLRQRSETLRKRTVCDLRKPPKRFWCRSIQRTLDIPTVIANADHGVM